MPLAIIDGVLRDKTGLPTAQLVAVVSETHEGVSYGVGQKVKGADGTRGIWLEHLELQLPVGEARDGRGGGGARIHLKTRWPSCSPRLMKSLLRLASLTCQETQGF